MAEWKLADAEKIRENLTKEQENEISNLYRKVYLDSRKQMLAIPKEGTTSQQIEKQYLSKLTKQLDEAYKSLGTGLEKEIKKQAEKAAEGVVSDANKFTSKLGFSIEGSYSTVSKDVVNSLVTGQVYGGNWSLSGAVWSNVSKAQSDISKIVAEGVAGNRSAYEIAKSLEAYVNPSAKKEWNWSKVYPGTSKKVEYNAQRLARTLVAHAYQQSLERVCKKNPFVDGYIWQSGGGPRTCPICADRNGKKYAKGDLPLDHPNGRCTFIADLTGSMDDVASRLADWANGKNDPELDEWLSFMQGSVTPSSSILTRNFDKMSEEDYKKWQEQQSTYNQLYSKATKELKDEFGIEFSYDRGGFIGKDFYIESKGVLAYDYANEFMESRLGAYWNVTNRTVNTYSYVQNADWSKNINRYFRTGDSSFLTDYFRKGKVKLSKAQQLGQEALSGIKKTSKALDSLIESTTLNKNMVVSRWGGANCLSSLGISTDAQMGRIGHAFVTNGLDLENLKSQVDSLVGTVMVDKGYMSASACDSLNVFQGSDIKFSINVKEGTHAFVTDNLQESEIIFGRGAKTEITGSRIIETEALDTWSGEKVKTKTLEIFLNMVE